MTYATEPSGFLPERPPANAVWRWRLIDAGGAEVDESDRVGEQEPDRLPTRPRFTSQSDAETWLGEIWRELAEDGVESVVLLEADREVYGPMSLHLRDTADGPELVLGAVAMTGPCGARNRDQKSRFSGDFVLAGSRLTTSPSTSSIALEPVVVEGDPGAPDVVGRPARGARRR